VDVELRRQLLRPFCVDFGNCDFELAAVGVEVGSDQLAGRAPARLRGRYLLEKSATTTPPLLKMNSTSSW
jgi:hypothetical protein